MKKTFRFVGLVMMAVLSYGMTACGGDDGNDDGGIDTTPISLSAGKDKTIQGADTNISSNRFVAYGSKNVVHGWHVGEATLMVNGKKSIPISVLPNYYLYNDPVTEWGCSMDYVKKNQKQGTLNTKNTDASLVYENAGAASFLVYNFENSKLKSIGAIVSTNHTSQFASFLAERYLMLPYYQGEDTYFIGADGMELKDAKSVVVLQVYSSKYLIALYLPANDYVTSTRSIHSENKILSHIKTLIEQKIIVN